MWATTATMSTLSLAATGVGFKPPTIIVGPLLDVEHNGRLVVNEVRDNTGVNLILVQQRGPGHYHRHAAHRHRPARPPGSILGSAEPASQRITL